MDIRNIDLNLLRVLDVLLREQHVSRAAQALHLSQPATSAALMRLREALGDPLLVRTARGMQPTERAVELAPRLRALLQSLNQLLQPPLQFEAAYAHQTFSVASTDYLIELVNQPLTQALTTLRSASGATPSRPTPSARARRSTQLHLTRLEPCT